MHYLADGKFWINDFLLFYNVSKYLWKLWLENLEHGMDVMVAYIIHYYQATLMESLFVIDYCYELERIEILLFQVVSTLVIR